MKWILIIEIMANFIYLRVNAHIVKKMINIEYWFKKKYKLFAEYVLDRIKINCFMLFIVCIDI
jgi:hypothetical protein